MAGLAPPSTRSCVPVTKPAMPLAITAIQVAISSAITKRPTGTCSAANTSTTRRRRRRVPSAIRRIGVITRSVAV